jgi:hypothetical protein
MEHSISAHIVPWEDVKSLAERMLLPECPACEERPSEENDFLQMKPEIEAGFLALTTQLISLDPVNLDTASLAVKQGVVYLLLVCGEHCTENTWTTELTIKSSSTLQNFLCNTYSCKTIKEVICTGTIFRNCLTIFCTKLTREKWRRYPAAVASFWWIISHVEV